MATAEDRCRYKESLLSETREELQKVDSKSSILLATAGVIVGVFLAGAVGGSWTPDKISQHGPRDLVIIALTLGLAGLCSLGVAVKPRIRRANQDHNRLYFFGHVEAFYPTIWSRLRGRGDLEAARNSFDAAIEEASGSNYERRLEDQVWHLSHIVVLKYRFIAIAMWLFASSIVLSVVALIWVKV